MIWILVFLILGAQAAQVIYYRGGSTCPAYPDVRCIAANVTTAFGDSYAFDGLVGPSISTVLPDSFVYRLTVPKPVTCQLCPVYTSIGIVNMSCTEEYPLLCACRTSVTLFSPAPSAAPTTAPTMMFTTAFSVTGGTASTVRMSADGSRWTAPRDPVYLYDRIAGQVRTPASGFTNLTACLSDVNALTYCCTSPTRFRCSDGFVTTSGNGTQILNYVRYQSGSISRTVATVTGIAVQSRDGSRIFSAAGVQLRFPSVNVTLDSAVVALCTNWDASLLAILTSDEVILFSGSGSLIWRFAVTGVALDGDDTLDHLVVLHSGRNVVLLLTRTVLSGIRYSVGPTSSPVLAPTSIGWTNPMKIIGTGRTGTGIAFTADENWMFLVDGTSSVSIYARGAGWTLVQRIFTSVTSIGVAGQTLYIGASRAGVRGKITAYIYDSGGWVAVEDWLASALYYDTYPVGGYILAGADMICTGTPEITGAMSCYTHYTGTQHITDTGDIHASSPGMEFVVTGEKVRGRIIVYNFDRTSRRYGDIIQLQSFFPGITSLSISRDGILAITTPGYLYTYDAKVNLYTDPYIYTTGTIPVGTSAAIDLYKIAVSGTYVQDRTGPGNYPLTSPNALPGTPGGGVIAVSVDFVAWSDPGDDAGLGAVWVWTKTTSRPTRSPSMSPTTSRPTRAPVQVFTQVAFMPSARGGGFSVSTEGSKLSTGPGILDVTPCSNPAYSRIEGLREMRFAGGAYDANGGHFDAGWSYANILLTRNNDIGCESSTVNGWCALTGYHDGSTTSRMYRSYSTTIPRDTGGALAKRYKRGIIEWRSYIGTGYDIQVHTYECTVLMTYDEAIAVPGFGYRVAAASFSGSNMVCSIAKYFGGTLECFRNDIQVTGDINNVDGEAIAMNWNGTYIVVGAPNLGTYGQVMAFTYPGFAQTVLTGNAITTRFGVTLDVAGDVLVVGSTGGYVFVMSLASGIWTHRAQILVPVGTPAVTVSCRGAYVVTGDSANRRVTIWKRGSGWSYDEYQVITRPSIPGFGTRVEISEGDGRTLAVAGTNQTFVYRDATAPPGTPGLCTGQ